MGLRVNQFTNWDNRKKHVSLQKSYGQLRSGGEGSLQFTDMANADGKKGQEPRREQAEPIYLYTWFWNSYNYLLYKIWM